MRRFEFRLHTVLRLREQVETETYQEFLGCIARRLEAERDRDAINTRRNQWFDKALASFADRLSLATHLDKLDDEEEVVKAIIGACKNEEEVAEQKYLRAKQEREALTKLKESQYAAWQIEAAREEQKALDEWSVMRRK